MKKCDLQIRQLEVCFLRCLAYRNFDGTVKSISERVLKDGSSLAIYGLEEWSQCSLKPFHTGIHGCSVTVFGFEQESQCSLKPFHTDTHGWFPLQQGKGWVWKGEGHPGRCSRRGVFTAARARREARCHRIITVRCRPVSCPFFRLMSYRGTR